MTKRKVTAKEAVLAVYPSACEWRPLGGGGLVCIVRSDNSAEIIGESYTTDDAWKAAARKLENPNG